MLFYCRASLYVQTSQLDLSTEGYDDFNGRIFSVTVKIGGPLRLALCGLFVNMVLVITVLVGVFIHAEEDGKKVLQGIPCKVKTPIALLTKEPVKVVNNNKRFVKKENCNVSEIQDQAKAVDAVR